MFTSKSQPKLSTFCEDNHNICMDENKQKTQEYNIDSTHSLDTINKSNRKVASNSKKAHRKTSFKNVKDFMSRIVMRQLQLSTNQLQSYDSEQLDYRCNTTHNKSDKKYFTNLNSCEDSAIVSVASVTPTDDTLLNDKCKGDLNISSMSAPKSNYSSSTMASNVSCNTSAGAPLSEAGDGTKYRHYSSNCESTIRPLVTHNNNSINSDQNIRHTRQDRFKIPMWSDKTPGTVGLHNHGNTCFMNAVLQCISNASFLSGYFVMGHYKEELKNNKNSCKKFGSSGEVTEQLGILLRSIWSGKYNPDISNEFKTVIGKYNSQFKGFNQHDAQEFLLWLLDQVHEDLNLPIKRNKNNQQGRFSSEKNTIASEISLSKQTIIYQMFRGLYQSSLTCLKCRKQSNTYDPYLCLSLPLPQICNRAIYIIIVYLDPNVTLKRIGILMKNTETFGDLRKCLSQLPSQYPAIPKLKYLLCQIDDNGYCNSYSDSKLLSDVAESEDIYLFELPAPALKPETSSHFHGQQRRRLSYEMSSINILLVHVEQINRTAVSGRCIRFCCPQIISVLRDISYPDLQKRILQSLGPALKENLSNYVRIKSISKQKLLMRLHVMDKDYQHNYLPSDVEMPLYMPVIDKVLGVRDGNLEELPLTIIVEWDSHLWEMIVNHTAQLVDEHCSVINVQTIQQKMGHTTLKDCFYLYTQEEELSGDAWRCPHCRHQQTGAIKKLRLCSLPEILIVHLKRFKQVKMQRNKVDILVDFPMWSLDLSQYLVNSNNWNPHMPDGYSSAFDESLRDVYDLFAVCNHYGNMIGGHYTAFCKNPVDGSWYQFDDTQVKPISKKEVVTKAAYLLFYQHRGLFKHQKDEMQTGAHWIYTLLGASSSLNCAPDPPLRAASYSVYQTSPSSFDQTSSCQPDSAARINPYDHPYSSPPVDFIDSPTYQNTLGTQEGYTNSSNCNQQSFKISEEERSPKMSAGRQQYQKTGGQMTNPRTSTELKKFATIARTENPNHYNQFDNNSSVFISRSKTYDDIKSCSQFPSRINSHALETEISSSIGSMNNTNVCSGIPFATDKRQSKYSLSLHDQHLSSYDTHSKSTHKLDISQGSETQSISEPRRYQPQLHLYKYKKQTVAFHKKKLNGPCLKESSV